MRIVIDIPEYIYELCNKSPLFYSEMDLLTQQVANGTILPKGCGRLIDAERLEKSVREFGMNDYEPLDFIDEIIDAPTVLEADGE